VRAPRPEPSALLHADDSTLITAAREELANQPDGITVNDLLQALGLPAHSCTAQHAARMIDAFLASNWQSYRIDKCGPLLWRRKA
jgi:hypothetical protein